VLEGADTGRVSPIDRLTELLQEQSLFRDADQSQVIAAIGDAEVLVLQPGDILLTPGSQNDTVYLLLSGGLTAHLDSGSRLRRQSRSNPENASAVVGDHGRPVSALVKAALKLSTD
jgi:hypothetical protein